MRLGGILERVFLVDRNLHRAGADDLIAMSNDLFKVVGSGAVKIPVNQKYPLKDAAKSHKDLEARRTTGSSILLP